MRRRQLPRSSGPNFIGLILFLLIIGAGAFLGIKFFPQLVGNKFGQADRFNFVMAGPDTKLVSLDIPKKTAVVLSFPADLYMTDVAFGYGSYRLSSVYPAGELDRRGGQTLSATLQSYVGVPVDGFVFLPDGTNNWKSDVLSESFIKSKSSLSVLEKLQVMYFVFSLRQDKINNVGLSGLTTPLVLADGSQAASLDPAELDHYLPNDFYEASLQNENLRVEVVNTTDITGLGAKISRLLTNIGISVIDVSDSQQSLDKCRIDTDPKVASSKTVSRIAEIFNCSVNKKDLSNRADVSVLIGSQR